MLRKILFCLFLAPILFAGEPVVNLLIDGQFRPVEMHGKPTAAYYWELSDSPRQNFISGNNLYLSGEKAFRLSFADGGMTITFANPLPPAYVKPSRPVSLVSKIGYPNPPAPRYHITGRIRFQKGRMRLTNVQDFKPAPDWQKIDLISPRLPNGIQIWPEGGAAYSVADFTVTALYPTEKLGAIPLRNGGKLTKIQIPKNAPYMVRWGTALWRGWLWKLTGIALPLEEVDIPAPAPGVLSIVIDKKAVSRGWILESDSKGLRLTCSRAHNITPALFDYLRQLGINFYTHSFRTGPADGSFKELPEVSRKVVPHFEFVSNEDDSQEVSGGLSRALYASCNTVDYYHVPYSSPYHYMNALIPLETYGKNHPEYFMMDANGKRVIAQQPTLIHYCFSNPEVRRIIAGNLAKFLLAQPDYITNVNLSPGDSALNCQCPACKKTNASLLFSKILEDAAIQLGNKRPETCLVRSCYSSRRMPPPQDKTGRIALTYCFDRNGQPCTLHVDCALNHKYLLEMKEWASRAGSPERMNFSTYRDRRPANHVKLLKYLSPYGNKALHVFRWHGYSPAVPFVTNRWNLGDDPEKVMVEFNNAYFGHGGKFITQIDEMVEQFAVNYKHTPEELAHPDRDHIAIFGGTLQSKTQMTRALLDKIYALFDQALAAARQDAPIITEHITAEKIRYLLEDLNKYNRRSCKNKADLQAFSARLAELIRCVDKYPALQKKDLWIHVNGRSFLASCAGIIIPNTGKPWTKETEIQAFLKNPLKALENGQEDFPGGWYFRANTLQGKKMASVYRYQCPPRLGISAARPDIDKTPITAILKLKEAPKAAIFINLEGLDDDKPGRSSFTLEINGQRLFSGNNRFPDNAWGHMGFTIPAKMLHAGENTITITNTTAKRAGNSDVASDGAGSAQWGWLMISEIALLDPMGEFQKLLQGKRQGSWCATDARLTDKGTADGTIRLGGGKVELKGLGKKAPVRLSFVPGHRFPKLTTQPKRMVRLKVTASGSGKLELGVVRYYAYEKKNGVQIVPVAGIRHFTGYAGRFSKSVNLTDKPMEFLVELKIGGNSDSYMPYFTVTRQDSAIITAFELSAE